MKVAPAAEFGSDVERISKYFRSHSDWQIEESQPHYCLPTTLIEYLQRATPNKRPLLLEHEVQRERDFTQLCRSLAHACGVCDGKPIRFPLFNEATPKVAQEVSQELQRLGWTGQQVQSIEGLDSATLDINERLIGYAGFLVTDSVFCEEREQLKSAYMDLDVDERCAFPLSRSVRLSVEPEGSEVAFKATVDFQSQLNQLLNRWGLLELTTWDLPVPQGPQIPFAEASNSPVTPSDALLIALPFHFSLLGSDSIMEWIRDEQSRLASQRGLEAAIQAAGHYKTYGQMFEIRLWEQVVRQRTEAGKTERRGFVAQLEEALAEYLGIDRSHVTRLRSGIRNCLAGRRAAVSWLNPRRNA